MEEILLEFLLVPCVALPGAFALGLLKGNPGTARKIVKESFLGSLFAGLVLWAVAISIGYNVVIM